MMDYPDFKVCVRCFTYNHSKYITDALNGFTMQQTDFPFVCCIVDDASTDSEQMVIRKYMEDNFDMSEDSFCFERETHYASIIYAQHKINENCFFAVLFLKENHYGANRPKMPYIAEWRDKCEYEAVCEGDDFWIDCKKLQMQANTLDNNKGINMCASSSYTFLNGVKNGTISPSDNKKVLTVEDVILGGGGYLATNTLFYRCILNDDKYIFPQFLSLDYTLQIHGSLKGGIYYIPVNTGVYRLDSIGSWTSRVESNGAAFYYHLCKVFTMLDILDYETEGQYHDAITKKKNYNFQITYWNGLNGHVFDSMIQPSGIKQRIVYALHFIFAGLHKRKII